MPQFSVSFSARCDPADDNPKYSDIEPKSCTGWKNKKVRDSCRVSNNGLFFFGLLNLAHSASKKLLSKEILCATKGKSFKNSRNSLIISDSIGLSLTISSAIPVISVIKGAIGRPGFISVTNRSTGLPSTNLMAAISIMRSSLGLNPVVSKSNAI